MSGREGERERQTTKGREKNQLRARVAEISERFFLCVNCEEERK
jgi:hypothetical protein